jgi:hypothetical protein
LGGGVGIVNGILHRDIDGNTETHQCGDLNALKSSSICPRSL